MLFGYNTIEYFKLRDIDYVHFDGGHNRTVYSTPESLPELDTPSVPCRVRRRRSGAKCAELILTDESALALLVSRHCQGLSTEIADC